ncbi:MAG TPA: Eco57I restriction-modification methylase domain-containing protein [Rhodanobacteraceae bacterium]|nr:Eco57I restriction-modification methylase domain-containing protein [Rhodanobacteraceae bacterium]
MNVAFDLFENAARPPELEAAIAGMAAQGESERGAIFTRPEVVEAILDLSGYVPSKPLHRLRVLEPSFGAGDFLLPIVRRLLSAYRAGRGREDYKVADLEGAVRAVELHPDTYAKVSNAVKATLSDAGFSSADADELCRAWLINDDFLLTKLDSGFDFVLGNPPYVRQERIPDALLAEYRRRYRTLYDRADLYVPFFERALDLLSDSGTVGFICANRWLKNRYGGPLREKISRGFWLKYFVDMEYADAFHIDVFAYPAVTIIQRVAEEPKLPTRMVSSGAGAGKIGLRKVVAALSEEQPSDVVSETFLAAGSSEPLLLGHTPSVSVLRRIEETCLSIEQAGCKIGIGVATGCDRVFIRTFEELPVEPDRKLPLVMARDLAQGTINWGGKALLNPFDEQGRLIKLSEFPGFEAYIRAHADLLKQRNVAKRSGSAWYRTIDRVQPGLLKTPKLLVPDIKSEGVFVLDRGEYYPHHNLYYIISEQWDLEALQAVLRSSLTRMTVAAYCTKMSGGFLRFQAQYLRRIRLPCWDKVSLELRDQLVRVANSREQEEVDSPVFELYGLSIAETTQVRHAIESGRKDCAE